MRLLIILLILITSNASAEIYKKKNADGSISYSDSETAGSEVIIPPKLTPTPAFKYKKKKTVEPTATGEQALPYASFSIATPKNQTVIRGNEGNLKITLSIDPALQVKFKHSISLFLDGKPVKTGLTSLSSQIKNLDRGSHVISALIVNQNNKALKTSQSITVHIKRHSKLHKGQTLPNPTLTLPPNTVPAS